ncbi:MAG: alpha-N-acetylglucosaminidase [Bacteroidales bacterium]|nr:alpha-N-acetylglucosaminidase [Bacteroidales bacterium]
MKRSLSLILAAVLLAGCAVDTDVKEARALAGRVLEGPGVRFLEFRKTEAETDVFRIESQGRKVVITGNNANSMATGLGYYLKHYCNISIGWMDPGKARLDAPLAPVREAVESSARVPNRFFLNYCTYGYTLPWWQWSDWERLIDWMALNGVNLPLAITGQESVWYEVWREMGLKDEEIRGFFSGPAHLPWHRMINIDGWQGPLPHSWLKGQQELQKKILARERALNMRPVLPAFAGHVPPALLGIYPDADVMQIEPWAGFPAEYTPYCLNPTDSLFPVIQKKFIDKQTEIYGTDHVYGIDLFNEIQPRSWEDEWLAEAGSGVYASLEAADPEAVWLQMTWLFWYQSRDWTPEKIRAFITSYPADRQLLLDYFCESGEIWRRTDSYFGVPYIWCYLGNFGGNTVLTGNIPDVDRRINEAFAESEPSPKGIGCTLEALDCNPYVFEYVLGKAWDYPSSPESYATLLADSRTGKVDEKAREAWSLLVKEVYGKTVPTGFSCTVHERPSLGKNMTWLHPRYEDAVLERALALLRAAGGSGQAYGFDLANLQRQVLANKSAHVYEDFMAAYNQGNLADMKASAQEFLALVDKMEEAVSGQACFSLDKWVADARAWGATPEEKDYYEENARCILSTWGVFGSGLTDYASRSFAGMLSTYYKARWEKFFDEVITASEAGTPFDQEAYLRWCESFEWDWWHKKK